MPHIYLAPWEWNTTESPGASFWDAPLADSCLQRIDLRPVPAQAEPGGAPQGLGLFVYDRRVSVTGAVYFGSDLNQVMTRPERESWQGRLNINELLEGVTLGGALWNTLTIHADAAGLGRVKPMLPQVNGELALWLPSLASAPGSRRKKVGSGDLEWDPVIAVLRADYRRLRQYFLDSYPIGDHRREHYKRVLGAWRLKYRVPDHRAFIPPDLPDEGWLPPSTTITESFDQSDSTTLRPDLTWTEVVSDFDTVSNEVNLVTDNAGTAAPAARAESDLSSDDHHAQLTIATLTDDATPENKGGGACARFDPSDDTRYVAVMRRTPAGAEHVQLAKIVSGTLTSLGFASPAPVWSLPDIVKVEADGSTIKAYLNGTEQVSTVDTAITGNLRTGITLFKGVGETARGNGFEAADLSPAGGYAHSRVVIVG